MICGNLPKRSSYLFKLSHIAIAVPKLKEIEKKLQALSLKITEEKVVPSEKVKTAFVPFETSEPPHLEFLEALEKDSAVGKFLEKKPAGGLHHLCFEIENIEKWATELQAQGFEILPPGVRKGAHGKVLFIHPKSLAGVLIELEEREHAIRHH